MKIIIIGSGTGALFTALTVKKRYSEAEVIIIDEKDFELLHPCGLPYVIEGRVDSLDKLKSKQPSLGQQMYLRHRVVSVVPKEKKVEVENLSTGDKFFLDYDKLVISAGASALVPSVPGVSDFLDKGVFKLDSYEDAFKISSFSSKSAVVVGAGAIGLETAYALKKKGLDVTLVEMMGYALPKSNDPDISSVLEDYLKSDGIKLMFDSKLEKVNGSEKVESVVVNGKKIDTDMVILSVGVKPNISFLEGSGISLGKWGIIVNENMQTNFSDIYAVGDCVQLKSLIDSRDWMMQLAVAAYKQGVVAGSRITGGKQSYKGALTTFASKIGSMEIAATGFNSHYAGQDIVVGKMKGLIKPEWCGDSDEVIVKLIVGKSGKILGGQAIGLSGAAERINVVSTAIKSGLSVYDLSEVELCYCPAVSETYDVLMQAGDIAIRRLV